MDGRRDDRTEGRGEGIGIEQSGRAVGAIRDVRGGGSHHAMFVNVASENHIRRRLSRA
jgi:hypothetical protein